MTHLTHAPTPYLLAAYGVTAVLLCAMLLLSFRRLRRLEKTLQEDP